MEKINRKTMHPKTGDNQKIWAFVLLALASAGNVTGGLYTAERSQK